ncbi:ABC transporter ATP-binding protein [Streptosporangium violaceochromogenes]|nr:ABC transporter ATP-binding protein [Streptosporangium violaceochromogenes]
MPTITFNGISKSFGANTVIKEFTAQVPDKDFLVLLGPSGCGKSTMLRMIAGLTEITAGELRFDDRVVNDLSPKKRDIAFVFQSYALYPHMKVRANIAFPLVMDNHRWWHHLPVVGALARRAVLKRPDVAEKVDAVAAMLELTDYLDRRPRALSGGQRQRVALARSLIRDPAVYLLDEPLSNLDAKLRAQMRAAISALHARVRKTFVYVTHDQVEAMTMGTRIIVLNDGVVQQYGTPKEIYDRPANVFVATFIGSPPMNVFVAEATGDGLRVGDRLIPASREVAGRVAARGEAVIRMGVRAEKVTIHPADADVENAIEARVVNVEHLGAETVVGFTLRRDEGAGVVGAAATSGLFSARLAGEVPLSADTPCRVGFDLDTVTWFDHASGRRVEL